MKSEAETCSSAAPQKKEWSFFSWLKCILWPPKKEKPEKAKPIGPPKASTLLLAGPSTPDEFERVFRCFDENGDGKISPVEIQSCMRTIGEEVSLDDVAALVESTDSDGDGLLGFDDFIKLVGPEEEEEKGRSLREAFQVYEMDDQECITPTSLKRALGKLGESKTIEECTVMIHRFDINGDGVISFDEFRIMML